MAKVSVIVPVYNTEKYLCKCLNSLLGQTLSDIEIILVDDASTDKSLDILLAYQEKNPQKIKVIKNSQNAGPAKARNIGLDLASGEYIGFVDSDDFITPNMYSDLLNACESSNSQLSRTNRKVIYRNLDLSFLGNRFSYELPKVINPSVDKYYLVTDPPCVTNKLFSRDLIADSRFPEKIKWEDYPFAVPLMLKANQVASIETKNYFYNIHLSSTSCTDARKLNPHLLDIFTCSDIVGTACLTQDINPNVFYQINYIQMQNCITRLKEIVNANIPLQEKRELLTLVSNLIKVKYGSWQDHRYYQEQKQSNLVHNLRLKAVEALLLPPEEFTYSEENLKLKIKEKLNNNS